MFLKHHTGTIMIVVIENNLPLLLTPDCPRPHFENLRRPGILGEVENEEET